MSYIVGINPYVGCFTAAQQTKGEIPNPGTRGQWTDPQNGNSREFVVVKFTANASRLNGSLVYLDADHVATLGTVAEGGLLQVGRRAAILTYNASAIATQTMVGTHFAWAQIYGKGKGYISGTVTASAGFMVEGIADGAVDDGGMASASANLVGLNWAAGSIYPGPGLADVFINYPHFIAGDL